MKNIILLAASLLTAIVASAQSRSALIHMKSGEIVEYEYGDISHITFTDPITYDLDLTATHAYIAYLGSGEYRLRLSDKPMSGEGDPTENGQIILCLTPIAEEPTDSHVSVNLANGRYVSNETMEVNTLYVSDNNFCVKVCTGIENGEASSSQLPLEEGTLNVSYTADGSCVLLFKGGFAEPQQELNGASLLKVSFSGHISIDNQDPYYYNWLEEDINVVPNAMAGTYNTHSKKTYGNYSLTFYNVPIDDGGFATGAGYAITLNVLTEYANPMDISKIAGVYTVTSAMNGPWAPGNYMNGEMYYGIMPIGSYLTKYDDSGNTVAYGLVTGGLVQITVDGDNVTYVLDLETESGKHFTMNYTAPASETIADEAKH